MLLGVQKCRKAERCLVENMRVLGKVFKQELDYHYLGIEG